MMDIGEIQSCIEENLRQNRVYEALIRDIKKFNCERHGRDNVRACSECLGVRCMICSGFHGCQCWNDE